MARRPARRGDRPGALSAARRLAVDVLVRVDDGAYVHALLPAVLRASALDARDRAFVTDLVAGTTRLRDALDFLLERVADRPVGKLDPRVRAGVRLGTYQLVRGLPAHAAVAATVEAVAGRGRGYVNAVLRRVAELGPPWPWPDGNDADALAVRTSHPKWLVEALVAELGADAARGVLDADNEPPALTLRPNAARTTADALAAELVAAGATVERGRLLPDALVVRGVGDPARLPAVVGGRATPQDQASQAVVALVDTAPGQRLLDVAAAPGGKATGVAERGASVVALDRDRGRLRMVSDAALRLDVDVDCVVGDAHTPPVRSRSFDRVLVDAPCSGLGVLRRRADARWRVRPAMIPEVVNVQRALLEGAAGALAPGGVLVYSVCTLTGAETEGIDAWLRRAHPELHALEAPGPPWEPVGRGARLLPQRCGTDGMYVLRLGLAP